MSVATAATAVSQDTGDPALEQFYAANGAYNRKLYPVAIGQFREFLRHYGNHAKADHARYGLGLSFVALKQYDQARPQFESLLQQPELPETIDRGRLVILYGQCLMFEGRKDDAKRMLVSKLEALEGGPFEAGALATITNIAYGKRDWDEVLKWSARGTAVANASHDQRARAYFQQGFAHYRKDDPNAAVVPLERLLPLTCHDSWKVRSQYLLGECYGLISDHAKAEIAYAAAMPEMRGADGDEARYRLGLTRFILAKYSEACVDFEHYLSTAGTVEGKRQQSAAAAPRTEQARLYAGRCLIETEQFDKARHHFRNLLADKGDIGAQANLWHARSDSRRGRYDEAAAHLAKVVDQYQRSAHASDLDFDFANALMSGKRTDWKQATKYFDRIERRGHDKFAQMPSVLSQAAVCYHQEQDYRRSLDANRRFLSRFADDALAGDVRFMQAENLFMLGKPDEANIAYGEFLAHHEDHRNTSAGVFRRAQILHDQGRWQASLDAAGPLVEQKPTGLLYEQLAFMVGDSHFRLDQWRESIEPLENFVAAFFNPERRRRHNEKVPNIDTALIQLAVAYDRLDDKKRALSHLATLNDKFPYHPSPHWPLALVEQGRLAFETGDLELARRALDRYLGEHRRNDREPRVFESKKQTQLPRAHYYLGWVADAQRRYPDAAKHFADVVKTNRSHELAADALMQQGIAYVNAEDFEAASRHFSAMVNKTSEKDRRAMVIYYAGLSQARLKNWQLAADHFREVVEKHPDSDNADNALYEWAWCERERKNKQGAVQRYELHLARYPQSPLNLKVQSELSELNLDSEMHDVVITRLSKARDEAQDPALVEEIRYQLANAHFLKGDHETAARQFETMLSDYPKSELLASIYFQAGEARFKLAETVKAREHFARGVKTRNVPKDLLEPMTMRLAEMQLQTNEFKAATQTYGTFLQRFRESAWTRNAQFGVAYATERGGDPKQAISQYQVLHRDVSKIDLWTVRARYQIGECHFDLRQYEKALEHFVYVEVNYKRHPAWQAKAVLEMGRVLIAQDQKAAGMERLKDVVKRFPKEQAAVVAGQLLDELRRRR